jgi:dihydroxyacid dehydratase/phosphogluconate dehydratase
VEKRRVGNIKSLKEYRSLSAADVQAAGYTDEDMKKPVIAVVSAYSEIHPGCMHLKTWPSM